MNNGELTIRKIIREALIDEDYESFGEIKNLNQDVLRHLGMRMANSLTKKSKIEGYNWDGPISFLPASLKDSPNYEKHQYPHLKNFIENSRVIIWPMFKNTKGAIRGQYNPHNREISLFFGDEFKYKLKELIGEFLLDPKNIDFDWYDFYLLLFYKFSTSLEHELQHAYDDFRSQGNTFLTKQSKKYHDKYDITANQGGARDPEQFKKYLNLPHEIWARFTQTMSGTPFYKPNNWNSEYGSYEEHEMFSIQDVVSTFTTFFQGWNVLPEKMKKRLIKAVVQFWHFEDEKAKEFNKKAKEDAKKREKPELTAWA